MKKILDWAKENKKILIFLAVLIIAGLAYYYRDKFMPGIASDAESKKPDTTPVDKNLTTPATPTRPVFVNEPAKKDAVTLLVNEVPNIIPAKEEMVVLKSV